MATSIDELTILTGAMLDAEDEVARLSTALALAKERLRRLKEDTIPGVLMELDIKSYTLGSGLKLSMKQDVYLQTASESKPLMMRWLDEHNYGGLIKTNVELSFGRSDRELARKWASHLASKGLAVEMNDSIHPQTMKAFLRERLSQGENIPLDLFGARPVWITTIKTK